MRAFVIMRQWAMTHKELSEKINTLEQQYGQKFKDIEQVLNYLINKDKLKSRLERHERTSIL